MANQALTQELVMKAQFDRAVEFLDKWLQVYTEAVFILCAIALCVLAWVVFREFTAPNINKPKINKPKINKRTPPERKAPDKPRLLQTEP